jgi:hypothetical protein
VGLQVVRDLRDVGGLFEGGEIGGGGSAVFDVDREVGAGEGGAGEVLVVCAAIVERAQVDGGGAARVYDLQVGAVERGAVDELVVGVVIVVGYVDRGVGSVGDRDRAVGAAGRAGEVLELVRGVEVAVCGDVGLQVVRDLRDVGGLFQGGEISRGGSAVFDVDREVGAGQGGAGEVLVVCAAIVECAQVDGGGAARVYDFEVGAVEGRAVDELVVGVVIVVGYVDRGVGSVGDRDGTVGAAGRAGEVLELVRGVQIAVCGDVRLQVVRNLGDVGGLFEGGEIGGGGTAVFDVDREIGAGQRGAGEVLVVCATSC